MSRPEDFRRSKARDGLDALARRQRQTMSIAERKLWTALRGRRFGGFKFRRQHAVSRFIADFVCVQAKLVIEVDGESHDVTETADAQRTRLFGSMHYAVIRVKNEDVLFNFEGVLKYIFDHCVSRATTPSPQPSPPITREREPEGSLT